MAGAINDFMLLLVVKEEKENMLIEIKLFLCNLTRKIKLPLQLRTFIFDSKYSKLKIVMQKELNFILLFKKNYLLLILN